MQETRPHTPARTPLRDRPESLHAGRTRDRLAPRGDAKALDGSGGTGGRASSVGVFGASGPWLAVHRDPTRGRAKKTPALRRPEARYAVRGPCPWDRTRTATCAQTSRERKLQIARARIAAIQAMAQTTYAAGGGAAAKKGFAATAGPSCDCAAMTSDGSRLQTAPRQRPSVGRMSFVSVPTFEIVSLLNAAPTPPTIPPIQAIPKRIAAMTPPTMPARRVESMSAKVRITTPSPRTKPRNSNGCGG